MTVNGQPVLHFYFFILWRKTSFNSKHICDVTNFFLKTTTIV